MPKYEVLIGEGGDGMLLPRADADDFSYVCLEHLEFSEVMYLLELFKKQTYKPLFTVREMDE